MGALFQQFHDKMEREAKKASTSRNLSLDDAGLEDFDLRDVNAQNNNVTGHVNANPMSISQQLDAMGDININITDLNDTMDDNKEEEVVREDKEQPVVEEQKEEKNADDNEENEEPNVVQQGQGQPRVSVSVSRRRRRLQDSQNEEQEEDEDENEQDVEDVDATRVSVS